MTHQNTHNYLQQIISLIKKERLADTDKEITLAPLASDGSSRLFFQIKTGAGKSFCGVLPDKENPKKGLAEARATFNIGTHLRKRGIPVPAIHGFDPENGFILFEDLGKRLLYDELKQNKNKSGKVAWNKIGETYKEIIEILLYMQISGSIRFNRKWSWDTQRYDKKLMLEKESGYFMQAYCQDLLGIKHFSPGLADEFKLLAGRAARQPAVYFLHRDFQSRNIMLRNGEIRIIDFQGGRLGPLGYDLASLLIDPYARIPKELQHELLEHYLEHLCKYGLDEQAFLKGYPSLALQRNLQILGAFAFLSSQKEKPFFRQFILPATISLQQLLAAEEGKNYPRLQKLTENILVLLAGKNNFVSVGAA
jgi:aminoglycoside/choline kinase family phosphotransferase